MEDAQQTQASGTLDVSDVDTALTEGQRRFNAQTDVAGTYGTFTLGPDGAWTYTLHNTDEDTDALGAGEKETDTFAVASADGTTAQVMVTVTGADDAAVIGGELTGSVMEDAQQTQASGTLDVSDVDTALTEGQRRFRAQTDVAGTYGTFTLGPDGAWTYTLHNTDEDTDALGAGEKETDTFAVASADGTTAQVMVTVTGADDAAVIGGDLAGAVTEDAQETGASGTLDVSDVDTALTGEQRRFNAQTDVAGRYGTFTLGPDGAWTYTLHNADPDTDALGAGQTGAERFAVFSTGGIRSEVVVTVTGSDDPAQIGGDLTGSVTEDDASAATASGTLTVSDPDSGERSFRISGGGRTVGRHGVFTLDADGEWTYTLDNASANALVTGQTVTERLCGVQHRRHPKRCGDYGGGCGRRGGDWRGLDGCGDRGRRERGDGERDADGERPGCESECVHGADGGEGDVRDVHAQCEWSVDVHAAQHGRGHRCAGCGGRRRRTRSRSRARTAPRRR